jgi:ubiquinone/menaquinone biosynthesis C-methylase UbiE
LSEHFGVASAVGVDICARQIRFANEMSRHKECKVPTFILGDVENLNGIDGVEGKVFDLALCIESWHTLPNPAAVLKQLASGMLADTALRGHDGA